MPRCRKCDDIKPADAFKLIWCRKRTEKTLRTMCKACELIDKRIERQCYRCGVTYSSAANKNDQARPSRLKCPGCRAEVRRLREMVRTLRRQKGCSIELIETLTLQP